MPIIDYRCRKGHVTTKLIPAAKCGSDHPESEIARCQKCRCKAERIYDSLSQAPTIGFTDKSGLSIVMHLNTATGEYSIPGNRDDELPGKGYKRVAITSLKQYEKVRSSVEATLKEDAQFKQAIEHEYFDKTAKANREATRQRMEQAISKGGHYVQEQDEKGIVRTRWAPISPRARAFFDAACRQADISRERSRQRRESGSPNFHSRLLEHRESERSIVTGTAKRPELPKLEELLHRSRR